MNKQEFLAELKQQLSLKMNHDEVTSTVEYYEGYINEAIDFGLSEEEALKQLGDIETIVSEVVNGLEDEHIDISKHEIVGQVEQVQSIEAMLKETSLTVEYGDYSEIEVFVSKEFEEDYLIKTENNRFIIKQLDRLYKNSFSFLKFESINRRMVIRIPKSANIKMDIQNNNSSIEVYGQKNITQGQLCSLKTKNSHIYLENVEFEEIDVETKNAKIGFNQVICQSAFLKTTNAKVEIEQGSYGDLEVYTTNGKVELNQIDVKKTNVKTRNGIIYCELKPNHYTKHLELKTTNALVKVDGELVGNYLDVNYLGNDEKIDLKFETTNAIINLINFKN